ncbi:MAG: ImmA/IrrE family metallo-endopeptidase [Thermoguttaceae bacterium]|nr:ImmA/IrrE family metallo-endopeptidase [Thermoguttaceae bacterium]
MKKFNASCLKLVREQRGWSQKEVAEKLGIKQSALSKYEHGAIEPDLEMRKKIAGLFDYPVEFFEQDVEIIPSGLVHHRKRSSLGAKLRDSLEAEARLRLMNVAAMANYQNIRTNGIINRDDKSPEEVARQLRKDWNIPVGPISDLTKLLEQHNIIVIPFDFETDKLDGFYICLDSGLICIVLNTNDAFAPDRNRFTLAHELGHVLLHRNVLPDRETEREADAFAAEFLMPEDTIRLDLQPPITFERLLKLKSKWKVSIGALIYRANKLKLLLPFAYRKLWTFMSSQGYRKKEPSCGIEREVPVLLNHLLLNQQEATPDLPTFLHLTASGFEARYPQLDNLDNGSRSVRTDTP